MLRLGIAPDVFWSLSLTEWRWLLAAVLGDAPGAMDAAALQALINRYPDKTHV